MSRQYAKVVWTADDVQSLKPEWSLEQCEAFLRDEERRIQDMMVQRGWEAIETLLDFDYPEGKVPVCSSS